MVSYRTAEKIESEAERKERKARERKLQWERDTGVSTRHSAHTNGMQVESTPVIIMSDEARMKEKEERQTREREFALQQGAKFSPRRAGWA
jgi:hypothetical protein